MSSYPLRLLCYHVADSLTYFFSRPVFSDSLVLEAAGGESAAKAFKESDEKGYQEAEVIVIDLVLHCYLCISAIQLNWFLVY